MSKSQGKGSEHTLGTIQSLLRLAYLLTEKCELSEAKQTFQRALLLAKETQDPRSVMEALSGLLRLAGEAQDLVQIEECEQELSDWMRSHPRQVPPLAWYCKGMICRYRQDYGSSQRNFHRFLRAASPSERIKAWVMLASLQIDRGRIRRAEHLVHSLLSSWPKEDLVKVSGNLIFLLGLAAEKRKELDEAMQRYQEALSAFMSQHHWYFHLHVLLAYARVARLRQDYARAYGYLDLVERACSGPEFGLLRHEVSLERAKLEQDAVDLLIDSRKAVVQTREAGAIHLGKQFVLLDILEALSSAHEQGQEERGLSKADLIEKVWREKYRPESHDNKLYYNINRLRKLIEPDVRHPQYLLNWKEGYRLAPGLKIRWVADRQRQWSPGGNPGEGKHATRKEVGKD